MFWINLYILMAISVAIMVLLAFLDALRNGAAELLDEGPERQQTLFIVVVMALSFGWAWVIVLPALLLGRMLFGRFNQY